MLDTMTFTKVVAALCGALLVLLLGKWMAEGLYHVGGHGKDHAQAYVIDTGEEEGTTETAEAEVDFATLLASADVAKGERQWSKCRACHKLEAGANGTGPYLHGVVGRPKASAQGFGYSAALQAMAGDTWTPENLFEFLKNPKGYAPGTTMSFAGLSGAEDRANLIAYIESQSN